jgi:hypothetical protein
MQPEYAPRAASPPAQPLYIVPRSAATDATGQDLSAPGGDRAERGWPIIRGSGG